MSEQKKAEFVNWMGPLLEVLRDLGGSGKPLEVVNGIIEKYAIPESKTAELLKSGMPRFQNQVYWARQYLVWEGYLDSTKKGVWQLTAAGEKKKISEPEGREIFKKWVKIYADRRKQKAAGTTITDIDKNEESENIPSDVPGLEHRERVLELLRSMSFQNFEKFCL